jgi:hypothetical protein
MERDTGEGVCVHSDTWGSGHGPTTLLFSENRQGCLDAKRAFNLCRTDAGRQVCDSRRLRG